MTNTPGPRPVWRVAPDISDFHYFVIQMLRYKVVDRRNVAANGFIQTVACLLAGCAANGAAR